jgi:hypothetical protein
VLNCICSENVISMIFLLRACPADMSASISLLVFKNECSLRCGVWYRSLSVMSPMQLSIPTALVFCFTSNRSTFHAVYARGVW